MGEFVALIGPLLGLVGSLIDSPPKPPALPPAPQPAPIPPTPAGAFQEGNLDTQTQIDQQAEIQRTLQRRFAGFQTPSTLLNQGGQDPNVSTPTLLGASKPLGS